MPKPILLRPATLQDVPEMLEVMLDAFQGSILSQRSFPPSDPETRSYYTSRLENNLKDPTSHLIIAEEQEEESVVSVSESVGKSGSVQDPKSRPRRTIAAWARWVRRVPSGVLSPAPAFTPDMYPRNGDGEFAARYSQANHNARERIMGSQKHWFLSTVVVRPNLQRRGLGSALIRFGTRRADAEGCPVYVNSSLEGKCLYERSGFRTVEVLELEGSVVGYHMLRDAKVIAT